MEYLHIHNNIRTHTYKLKTESLSNNTRVFTHNKMAYYTHTHTHW